MPHLELKYNGVKNLADNIVIDRYPFVLGRHAWCDHRLFHPMVSRHHCRITRKGEEVVINDLQSSNGTYVNGLPIKAQSVLHDGDELHVGLLSFKVSLSERN